ncbi:DNA-directed RNA polymerase subunit beta [Microbacterium sp. KKR3/1]|uniref:DNA-directed RNA polymerase subunit beta n=1 Tax=Microbacterium sp. KKR3/1 TaxID=2904241 RepID=UPI001E4DA5A3|nr:DNA-directed RNA polymerase subunit beta [Microbacterium sp. KKR3/1]MCE0510646.1 DNA-directed RNA polymerase subunit beta [Microbacterium sp. KKR3/1]
MPEQHHRPVRRPTTAFDNIVGSHDPAEETRVAHATASALLTRVRADESGASAERLVAFTAEHGIDEIAELWSKAPSRTLPGALWRLYVLQLAIHADARMAALLYDRGRVELSSADTVIAGAPVPAGPEELVALIDTILRGAFRGDFAVALDRAAAFCRVQASGATHTADDYEPTEPARASELTTRALRLSSYAQDLAASAVLWRTGALS